MAQLLLSSFDHEFVWMLHTSIGALVFDTVVFDLVCLLLFDGNANHSNHEIELSDLVLRFDTTTEMIVRDILWWSLNTRVFVSYLP